MTHQHLWRSLWKRGGLICLVLLSVWVAQLGSRLYSGSHQPADAVLVLGGSIRREMAVAQQVAQGMRLPVLISQGSQPPCIRLLFERSQAPLEQVWLENCAQSTFDNFRFSLPILQSWEARRVRVVTSGSQFFRARGLALLMLGSHGIWVDMVAIAEKGIPGNQESSLKTLLDWLRATGWALVSQVYAPQCDAMMPLTTVNLATWRDRGFQCEHQSGIEDVPQQP